MSLDRGGRSRRAVLALVAALLVAGAGAAWAHERFIKHNLKHPLKYEFFSRWSGPDPALAGQSGLTQPVLGMHPDMFRVGLQVFLVLFAFFFIWFSRNTLVEIVQHQVLVRIGGPIQRFVHGLACFITDRPVKARWFKSVGEWAIVMFMRSPALVLMFSATNDSLVMPSYPLDPTTATFFKFAQVLLAILILTQTLLPLAGAMVIGTWLYLLKWGWMVSVDAIPVLTVAVLYVTSPWHSHKLAITEANPVQARWVRIILGGGFFCLGWLKVWNHNLVAGVADNFPGVMNDPMIKLFSFGTHHVYQKEAWIIAFALAEVLSGFMVMVGVFTRLWATIMVTMFTKLMLVDFGWDEIPHIYPIGALLCVLFSNHLKSDFGLRKVEDVVEHWRRESKPFRQLIFVGVPALIIAFLVIFPLLWTMTFYEPMRTNM